MNFFYSDVLYYKRHETWLSFTILPKKKNYINFFVHIIIYSYKRFIFYTHVYIMWRYKKKKKSICMFRICKIIIYYNVIMSSTKYVNRSKRLLCIIVDSI